MSKKTTISLKEAPNLTEIAVNSIYTLLEQEGIETVLYIDDKFDIEEQKSFFIGMTKQIKSSKNYPKEDILEEKINWHLSDSAFNTEIQKIWDKNDDKKNLIHGLSSFLGDSESSNIIPALEFENHFKDGNIIFLTPQQWIDQKEEILKTLKEEKRILCLFDFELEGFLGPNKEQNGIELTKSLIESEHSDKVICGIFSHKYSEEDEDSYRKKYSEQFSLDERFFCTISKSRFAFDPKLSGFAEGIKYILSTKYVEDLKGKSIKIIEEANISSINTLQNISPKTFNQIVQKSSYKEGVWEIKTLFRLNNILSSDANYTSLLDENIRKEFVESIEKIRNIDNVETGYITENYSPESSEIRKKELYTRQQLLNKLNLPLANGDMFKIGNKEYILSVQPCNLALRNNGKRSRDYNKGVLIPLSKLKKQKFNQTTSYKLFSTDLSNDEIIVATFPDYKIINLDLLDLTVFNSDNFSSIDLTIDNIENNVIIQSSWKKRYRYIHKNILKHEKAYIAYEKIKNSLKGNMSDELKLLNPYFDRPFCINKFTIGKVNVYNKNERIFNFPIERIKRYNNPFAIDLLQNFMSYLSRNGFEVDFTNK
ncbi:hypothetical protein KORDIASMS9_04709 [Kordia sp. SMS9]|uniref:hypothetical protein n=1 Tax=Kordia sp. SMS9 TaxID=2282170 RepID=UPI000E0D8451|nr:hypothetical protein [Kordia sp. SMS9]AXG72435.1 hypothetical protein KORDIASMS9_04709 [Kordia sp. SMS9]